MEQITRSRRTQPEAVQSLQEQIINSASEEITEPESIVGPDPAKITPDRLIPSGVTLINCACSDTPDGAFALGSINTLPGQSAAGKTLVALNLLASCAIDSRFDNYELILDDAEHTLSFDLQYLFPPLVERLRAPKYDKEDGIYSETIQDFEVNILSRLDKPKKEKKDKEEDQEKTKSKKKPFIYILDSLDSLSSTEELEREFKNAIKSAKSAEAVAELKKSYGTEKSKILSSILRMVNGFIKKSDSILFILQQLKQNMNRGFGEPEWITTGGEAPFFFSFHRLFLSTGMAISNEAMNIKDQIGSHTYCQIIKNKLTGKKRKSSIEFDIYEDLGIDDISSCVDFLKKTGYWSMEGAYMLAPGILGNNEKMYRKDLIQFIEKENAEPELRKIVGDVWKQKEDLHRLTDRKRRF